MDTSHVLDLSKENVQPLVHGRKTDKLTTVLQVNSNFQLQQELKRHREEFELQIRLYNGDDPLQLRFEYVQWLEQSYPCLGPETNIIPFLEETLVEFKNIEHYKQDPRYVSLVIKYIETQPNPLEIYNLVYSENIGTSLAMFYKAWADKLDAHGDIKQANHVFQLGLNAQAEPLEDLEAAQMQFQLSVGRRCLMTSPSQEQPPVAQEQPQRQVLGKLKRVTPGMTRLKMGEAGRMSQHADSKKPLQNTATGLNVYMDPCEDENNYAKEPSLQNSHFKIKAGVMHKENTEAPGVWTKKKTKKFATPIPIYPSTPSFPIHKDDGFEEQGVCSSAPLSSALKTKKMDTYDMEHHASTLFESGPGSKEKNMFSKNKIFLGKTELQIEEFRAAKHRMEKYGSCLPPLHNDVHINENVSQCQMSQIYYGNNKNLDVLGSSQQKKKLGSEDDIPVCIPEPEDKRKVPMYKKKQIYIGNNKEVQLEEVRADIYKTKRSQSTKKNNPALWTEEIPVCIPCDNGKAKCMYPKSQIYIGNNKETQWEEIRAAEYRARKLKARKSQAITQQAAKAPSFAVYCEEEEPQDNFNSSNKPERFTSFAIYSDDHESQPSSNVAQLPGKTSFVIYSDTKEQEPDHPGISQSKVLTFSTSEDESLEKKSITASGSKSISGTRKEGSAKKLGLFDMSDKDLSCNMELQGLVADESSKDVLNMFDDMWKSPAARKSKSNKSTPTKQSTSALGNNVSASPQAQQLKSSMEPKLDISGVTMNYTVNTKEAMKLVHDWWSSPAASPSRSISTNQGGQEPDDVTFKKPVSIKKVPITPPSRPTTTPFKIFSEESENVPLIPPKTPAIQIYTDENMEEPQKMSAVPPKTPKFEVYSDENIALNRSDKKASFKTPKFEIFSDVPVENPAEKLSCSARARSCPSTEEQPKTPFSVFCDEEPKGSKQSQKKPAAPFNNYDSDNIVKSTPRRLNILEEDELARPLGDEDIERMETKAPQLLSLPYVAPAIDLDMQPLGHEFKENCPPGDQAKSTKKSENQRVLNGYLVPSSVPIHLPEGYEMDEEETDMTCNTRAFNFVLPSSTPFINMRNKSGSYMPGSNDSNGSFLQEPASKGLNLSYRTQCDTQNLSIILEASKEKSSSSSGSSGFSGLGGPSSYFNSCEKKPPMLHPIHEHNGTSGLEESVADLDLNKIDPFDEKLIDELLSQKVQFPLARHRVGYECFFSELNSLKVNSHTSLGSTEYTILKELGKGAYARVLMGKTSSGSTVALKQQRPACVWEWYVTKEIEFRLKPQSPGLLHFVLPHHIYVFKNSSVLASPWAKYGNLLDLVNMYKFKMGKSLSIQACLKLNLEMTRAIHTLHKINIIHGDVKPDNFVICNLMRSGLPTLKLIDFGRSIDMSLFPANTTFTTVVTTDGFQCTEMKEGREWSYHTDLYGLAGSMCCTLLGKYMNTVKKDTKWVLADTIPRYLRRDIMEPIFDSLLNLPHHYDLRILEEIILKLEQTLVKSDEALQLVDDVLTQLKL